MDETGESVVREFDYGGQHVTIYRRGGRGIFAADYAYSTSGGTWGCVFKTQTEAENTARTVIDDQATRWLEKAVSGE